MHTCALTASGAVKCWGHGGYGQLGNGSYTHANVPVDVTGLASGVIAITASHGNSCALTTGGGVKCWGYNITGQLGLGSSGGSAAVPVDVMGLANGVIAISADGFHSCALTTLGGVKCWGYNAYGQLGSGSNTDAYVPVEVTGLASGVIAISADRFHSCALTTGGGPSVGATTRPANWVTAQPQTLTFRST